MTPSPVSPQPVPQKPSGCSRGCLVALVVVGALFLLGVVIAGVVMWRVAQSPEGKKAFSALGKGVSLATKGLNAPGVEQVRNAGCPEAMALDLNEMMEIVELFADGGVKDAPGGVMVMCQGYGQLPSCDTVAKAYASAPGRPPGDFIVIVKTKNAKADQCSAKYSETGEYLEEFDKKK